MKVCSLAKPVNAAGPLVVLWDIDGTLLSSDGAGRWAMEQSFRDLFGVRCALRDTELAGRTDEVILMDSARAAGLTMTSDDQAAFRSHYARLLEAELTCGWRTPLALPGVVPLLAALADDFRFISGLLTGNWQHSAYIKLASVGLADWFSFGAFAGDAPTREDLLPVALRHASQHTGTTAAPHRAVIIGDTPRDVSVARAHGAHSIGVATGPHTSEELNQAGADVVVDDLTDPRVMTVLADWHAAEELTPGP